MRGDKKGISNIVVSLLMIVLVMVAMGIIFFVVRDVVESGEGKINLGTRCLEVDVRATKLTCTTPGVCDVTVERRAGGDEIAGIKLIFTNDLGETNFVKDVSGNIGLLSAKTESSITTGIENANKVEVAVYFSDSSGNEQLCSTTTSFSS